MGFPLLASEGPSVSGATEDQPTKDHIAWSTNNWGQEKKIMSREQEWRSQSEQYSTKEKERLQGVGEQCRPEVDLHNLLLS